MADFKINRIRFTWKSDWSAATTYTKDDIVRYGGKSYVCLVGHTASADFNTDLEFIDVTTTPDEAAPKWVLWFDGYEWKNNWLPSTFYDLGDYVRYGSIIYICNESHTSSATTALGLEADQAKWTQYAVTENWVKDWTVSTRYKLNDTVRYGGTLYRCNFGHTSSATLALGLESNESYWDVLLYANDWKTDWTVSTRYKLGDVVRYGGIVYKAIEGHTSAATIAIGIDSDLDKWEVVHSGIEYRFAWAEGIRYRLNDVVKYGADLYICAVSHTSIDVFSTTNFVVWVPGLQFANAWLDNVFYVKGDIVSYGGYEYTSNTTNNLDNKPGTDSVNWTLLVKNYNITGDWGSQVDYRTGDLVRRNGYLYVAIEDNKAIETTDTDNWKLVNPGMHWRGPWVSNSMYAIGDVVTYFSTSYICTTTHSATINPLADTSNDNWTIYVRGDQFETLQNQGDMQTYSSNQWEKVNIGTTGQLLKADTAFLAVPSWDNWGVVGGVYYVATTGVDDPSFGTTISTPWRSVKYACGQVVGPATIFIKTGTYSEELPIRVPAGVALVGDELRGTVIQPARTISCIATACSASTNLITVNTTYGIQGDDPVQVIAPVLTTTASFTSSTGNKITLGFTIGMYINMPIVFTGLSFGNLVSGQVYYVQSYDSVTATITVSETVSGPVFEVTTENGTMTAVAGGFGNLVSGQVYYVIGSTITDTQFKIATSPGSTVPVQLTDSSNQTISLYGADAINNMFFVRNGCGIRNMTLRGLLGGLSSPNVYGTKRPTGGAFVSLDPGAGPNDTSVQITTKSPYCQNVSLFGQGCTGMKIDGSLHNNGNRSIVANDYTTLISDGIGVWCTGHNALTELVSVFAYYSHCGYLAEDGGKIRATNGNTSYGTYGCVAEGFDTTEIPIAATVNNRNQPAQIATAFIGEATNKFLKLEFTNAGQNYTGATFAFSGSGVGAVAVADEFRDGGIYEARIIGTDFEAGGLGYITAANQAQAGDINTITIASNDQNLFADYYGMRLIVTSGTGVGQYGYIAYYNTVTKVATIAKESVQAITSSSTNATNNLINVGSTSSLNIGTAIVIVPNQQDTTAYNTVHTVAVMTTAYINGNSLYVISMGAGAIAVGMVLTGPGIAANTYITSNNQGFGSGSTWTINMSQTVGNVGSPITITGTNNLVTLTSSENMTIGEQIVFTGSTFGGIVDSTKYYIYNIIGNQVVISATYGGTPFAVSNATGSMAATAGGMLGGLIAGQVYYVLAANFSSTAFAVSTSPGGTAETVTTQTYGSSMQIHTLGWENLVPGTPAVSTIDSTSVYSIEPCVKFTSPSYSASTANLPSASNWISVAYGNGRFVAITSTGTTSFSLNGQTWSTGATLPAGTYTEITFGNGFFVAITTTAVAAYSADGAAWISITMPSSSGYHAIAYGNGGFIAVQTASATAAYSADTTSWAPLTLPVSGNWKSIAYGSIGTWVAIAGNSSAIAAYSTDNGSSWMQIALPSAANWISVEWGNGRFVAIASGSSTAAYSFDGINWLTSSMPVVASWTDLGYGQGLFFAVAAGTTTALTSQDGVVWTSRTLASAAQWSATTFGNPSTTPMWVAVSTSSSNTAAYVRAGATALGRATVASNKISVIKIWEPGSGYTNSPTPTLLITDPNPTSVAVTICRVGNGVLGNPTFTNRGSGYRTSTTVVTISAGTGYADIYQSSKLLTISGLDSLPTPGAALTITNNPNQYRIVVINDLGNGSAQFQVSPPLTIELAPEHGTTISIRQKYSQCRITGHDFLLVGTGNQTATNYPYTDITTAVQYQQIAENNGGRVFQTSTDQDGNFKVGNLFAVEQASGIVTISADQLSLTGLQTLSLGGFSLGTNTVTITQFSTDSYFTANSDTIVPTQRAIKTYIARNIAGGGANAQAGAVVAGTFGVGGPNRIYSSTQSQLYVRNSMRITKGINGTMLAKSFFAHGFSVGGSAAGK